MSPFEKTKDNPFYISTKPKALGAISGFNTRTL